MKTARHLIVIIVMAPLLMAADCQNPEVSLPSNIRKIAIPTFVNTSDREGIELDVTQRILNQFMASSQLAVTPRVEEADGVLRGEIYRYQRAPVSWDQTNRIVQYKIKILCRVGFYDRTSGEEKLIWQVDDIDGVTAYSLLASPPETEELAIFSAADELARDIINYLYEQRQYTQDDLLFSESNPAAVQPGEVQRR
ncbi:MAG: hypothetical protein COS94_07080 [Candidatus Hydrogenedentes bacterium CG07_land_8_20_14_0_80_42_17]|nr:MAG: hypothetical protein COS94_07080 [Candidatus Hydrogenedentes bacterium CG07_land_8_20_14_0_80_42_17]